jgi:site-specific DNA recombinase
MASASYLPLAPHAKFTVLYLWVSSREQVEGYSIDAQRRASHEWAKLRGLTIIAEYVDEGISARPDLIAKRPAFARMLGDAETGAFSVIVVHKMDRFARNLRITLECLERLGRAHVGVASVSEPDLDYSTPQGFLFLSMPARSPSGTPAISLRRPRRVGPSASSKGSMRAGCRLAL